VDIDAEAFYRYGLAGRRQAGNPRRFVKPSLWSAVFTDIQFWVPVIVLVLGAGLLLSLR
jgi:hypothetical protein